MIATQPCSTLSVTCLRVVIVHFSAHILSCACLVAIGQWLTQVILLISNISVPSLVHVRCQATSQVLDYVAHAPALKCKQLAALMFCVCVLRAIHH